MKAMQELEAHLSTRLESLKKEKEKGRKIIGYLPTGYFPEEIVLAFDAIPLGFIFAGNPSVLTASMEYISKWFDPFFLSQITYYLDGGQPYYDLVDYTVNAAGDTHVRAFTSITEYPASDGREQFYLGVPHTKQDGTKDYYRHGMDRLIKELETLTGQTLSESKLREAITLCNRERALFDEIRSLRLADQFAVTCKDFMALQHGTHLADKKVMIGILERYLEEVKRADAPSCTGPRVLLTGTGIGLGDSKLPEAIEKAGGAVVYENFIECVRPILPPISLEGDLLDNIAQTYFLDQTSPGWHNPVDEYVGRLIELIKEYRADCIIWYHGMYRESYKVQSYYVPDIIRKQTGLETIVFETYYEPTEIGPMQLRVKSFIDLLKEENHV